jgi:hypothetical protein
MPGSRTFRIFLSMPLLILNPFASLIEHRKLTGMRGQVPESIGLTYNGNRQRIWSMAMKAILIAGVFLGLAEVSAMAEDTVTFEADAIGAAPKGWTATKTGRGQPKWSVEQDPTAPSKSRVVKQSGQADYPLLLKDGTEIKDGFIQIKFKAIAGSEDRAAGVVWRARDANNYYVVRANALEDNVVLYKTVEGVRGPLDIVGRKGGYGLDVPVPANEWLSLRLEFKGSRFRVIYSGRPLFEVEDLTFRDAGKIGLWTKADV